MKKEEKEVNVLDELNKGTCMGMDAIHFIKDKVKDKELKELIDKQYNKYQELSNKICDLYPEYSNKEPHETNTMNKVMTWYGIEMKTIIDDTTSKLAELLIQGTNMGIIEGRRLLNKKDMDAQTRVLVQEYVDMQESSLEELKKYL